MTYEGTKNDAILAAKKIKQFHLIQLLFLFLILITSSLSAISFSQINYQKYSLRCVPYAKWDLIISPLSKLNVTEGGNYPKADQLQLSEASWGWPKHCHLLHFGFVSSGIVAMLFIWGLCLLKPTKEDVYERATDRSVVLNSAKVVVALAFFGILMTVLCTVASVDLYLGVTAFCKYVLTWLTCLLWLIQVSLTVYRMVKHLDFPDFLYTPIQKQHKSLENGV